MAKISKIVSGGQTGVDRAALDFAINNSIEYGGWCPKGGWAEDYPTPPGLLAKYGNLKETPSAKVNQRTKWNVRDSDLTIIVIEHPALDHSKGTEFTAVKAEELKKPIIFVDINNPPDKKELESLLDTFQEGAVINIAGPRESESPGIYSKTSVLLHMLLKDFLPCQ